MKSIAVLLFYVFSQISFAGDVKLSDLALNNNKEIDYTASHNNRNVSSLEDSGFFNTRNLSLMTLALLGATALTGREQKTHPVHVSLAGLSFVSYGMFLNSYMNNDKAKNGHYKTASYAQWAHIPAMIILPIAGAMAQRDFNRGLTEADGFGKAHKPAALAAFAGVALSALSLTFDF